MVLPGAFFVFPEFRILAAEGDPHARVRCHGNWLPWLEAEFGFTPRTAQNFMNVADKFKYETVSYLDIAPKALYLLLLAQNSTPDEARKPTPQR